MGFNFRSVPNVVREFISKAGAKLPRSFAKIRTPPVKLRGLVLLLGGIIFARIAYQITQTEALRAWERTHQPSATLWQHVLHAQGYVSVQTIDTVQAILRFLPAQDESVWASQDFHWIALPSPNDEMTAPHIFTKYTNVNKNPLKKMKEFLPHEWTPFPKSWMGFQEVLKQIESGKAEPIKSALKTPVYRDPREIRY